MLFGDSRINFFKISWLDCEIYANNQYKKRNMITIVFSVQSVKITFILFKCHRSIDNSIDFYLFILS